MLLHTCVKKHNTYLVNITRPTQPQWSCEKSKGLLLKEKEGMQTKLSLNKLKHSFSLILSNLVEELRRFNVRNIIFCVFHSCWLLFRNNLNSISDVIVFALRGDL